MEKVIATIKELGWNKSTQALVREALVNQPTNRIGFNDISRCFREDHYCGYLGNDINAVIDALQTVHLWRKHPDSDLEYWGVNGYGYESVTKHKGRMDRKFTDPEEWIEFWNGTSYTRAKAWVENGGGYTELEAPVRTEATIEHYGLQVMLNDSRAYYYGKTQAYPLNDKIGIVHGRIQAKYLYPENNGYEYCIPCEYYNKAIYEDVVPIRVF